MNMVNGILWLLDNDLRGPFNMVSPYPVRNEQFAHALGQACIARPFCASPQPPFGC
ncbi:NAD(P)-binding Rossmann-fold domain [Escherichia coli]|uniref:NAD(P)-binding Rossmann-fold domain n=1 Tax=Escherichia coli TaxID=562 RepID=A0A377CBM6_ECOLX|nr:NAD(P)-binding Rossmann-fold domain [Escherichia coli]